jgi:hypothetical protein
MGLPGKAAQFSKRPILSWQQQFQRLAQMFADERSKLEGQFKRGDNVSTEDLRVALRHYRSFFARLLSV